MFKDFINIREYAIEIIYISDHWKKGTCQILMWYHIYCSRISSTLDIIDFVGLP